MGERRVCIEPHRDVAQMESVCDFWSGRNYTFHVWLDSRHRASRHAPVIHRSIWPDLLYSSGPAGDHMCIPEQFCLCLYGEVVRAGVRLGLPLCPDHVVVSQLPCALMAWARTPRHRIEVVICASGNFWVVTRGRIPRLPGR